MIFIFLNPSVFCVRRSKLLGFTMLFCIVIQENAIISIVFSNSIDYL